MLRQCVRLLVRINPAMPRRRAILAVAVFWEHSDVLLLAENFDLSKRGLNRLVRRVPPKHRTAALLGYLVALLGEWAA